MVKHALELFSGGKMLEKLTNNPNSNKKGMM
jgi:hypothetical protein